MPFASGAPLDAYKESPASLREWLLNLEPAESQENPKEPRKYWQYQAGMIMDE